MALKGIPSKVLSLLKALYTNSRGRLRVYSKLSPEFTTSSGVRQGCHLSPFLFNFVTDLLIESSLPVSGTCGVELLQGYPLVDIEYADDVVLLGSDPSEMQAILNKLNNSTALFGMRFTPPKCRIGWDQTQTSF